MKKLLYSLILFIGYKSYTQEIGDRITYKGGDGKIYNGTITKVEEKRSKIKYDGMDFIGWMANDAFQIVGKSSDSLQVAPPPKEWKVGDTIEAQNMFNSFKWENATISVVNDDRHPVTYQATLDQSAGRDVKELTLNFAQIRERGIQATVKFALNTRVDVSNSDGTAKGRGTIIKVISEGVFKVRYDGCTNSSWDEQVKESQLRPVATISAYDPAIRGIFGKWAIYASSYPVNTANGASSNIPPLQINADSTYTWYDTYSKSPAKGTWVTHAKMEGVRTGTELVNGILIKDSKGVLWKVYRFGEDHIEARKMCASETLSGVKIK